MSVNSLTRWLENLSREGDGAQWQQSGVSLSTVIRMRRLRLRCAGGRATFRAFPALRSFVPPTRKPKVLDPFLPVHRKPPHKRARPYTVPTARQTS